MNAIPAVKPLADPAALLSLSAVARLLAAPSPSPAPAAEADDRDFGPPPSDEELECGWLADNGIPFC